jgi:hypothetical protein
MNEMLNQVVLAQLLLDYRREVEADRRARQLKRPARRDRSPGPIRRLAAAWRIRSTRPEPVQESSMPDHESNTDNEPCVPTSA